MARCASARSTAADAASTQPTAAPTATDDAAAAEDRYLWCFVASHVDSPVRVAAMARLFASIGRQMPHAPPVCVSWHATADAGREGARRVLDEAPWLRCSVEHAAPRTQFEHLAALVARCSDAPPAWVIFSDDDDLWAPTRSRLFAAECRRIDARRGGGDRPVVLCRRKARPHLNATNGTAPRVEEPSDASDVRALLRAGLAALTDTERVERCRASSDVGSGETREAYHRAEYFDFAVRFALLREFVHAAPRGVLAHKLCDLGFVRWLRARAEHRAESIHHFLPSDPADFVYWYGMFVGGASVSQEVDVSADDEAIAARYRDPALFRTDRLAARYLAVLRERLGQELLQLRAADLGTSGDGIAPKQLIDVICERQANAVLAAAARSWPANALPALRAWGLEVARGPLVSQLLRRLEFEAVVCTRTLAVETLRDGGGTHEQILARIFQ